ncbi:hypothetical protein OG331_50270 [Streptomyces sp. NBC_01017]|uniref:hypothetical protein n=1 Tax=Streptomyces sp. NBC_01017 TaxID=2903721 RepID=UPI003865C34D|nr:hypothetical protein OG331_01705 [Streptomyces sp. NBC_01017]WSV35128.1 hypothetical protein OG331_50270 [Streptomyces sp. NBC_01017]
MPRFKSKRKACLACRFTTGTLRVESDGRHVTLPWLGTIRTRERTAELLGRVQAGKARVLSAAVRHERGRGQRQRNRVPLELGCAPLARISLAAHYL